MHSHHSHSGQYVSHAVNTLEECVNKAIELGFEIFCLTEHMPRYDEKFLYPEEVEKEYNCEVLEHVFEDYVKHARELQTKCNSDSSNRTKLIVGFETEGGCGVNHLEKAVELKSKYDLQLCVGSIHHVNGVEIDFDRPKWEQAIQTCKTKSIRGLFLEYYQIQYQMLKLLEPEVVGHFDLIRLMLNDKDLDTDTGKLIQELDIKNDWPEVWAQILQNIDTIVEQDSLIELNSSAIRKGWQTPYPKKDIVDAIIAKGGKFCFSDDSHGISQIGLNYLKVLNYVKSLPIEKIYFYDIDSNGKLFQNSRSVSDISRDDFWKVYKS